MPTSYKVLGQVEGTAAPAATLLNAVVDPGFELMIGSSWLTSNYNTGVYYELDSGTRWRFGANNSSINSRFSSNFQGEINVPAMPASLGNRAMGWLSTSNGSSQTFVMGLGKNANSTLLANGGLDVDRSVFVTENTTYNFGMTLYTNSSDDAIIEKAVAIRWFSVSGPFISTTLLNLRTLAPNVGVDGWTRFTQSVTAPAGAGYATIEIISTRSANVGGSFTTFWVDNIVLGLSSDYAANPSLTPLTTFLTPPFTSRETNWSGTPHRSTFIRTNTGGQQNLYVTPANTQTVVSSVTISDLGVTASSYRLAVVPLGQTLARRHWITFDTPIAANSTQTLTLGLTLNAGDRLVAQTDSNDVVFSAFGSEITP